MYLYKDGRENPVSGKPVVYQRFREIEREFYAHSLTKLYERQIHVHQRKDSELDYSLSTRERRKK